MDLDPSARHNLHPLRRHHLAAFGLHLDPEVSARRGNHAMRPFEIARLRPNLDALEAGRRMRLRSGSEDENDPRSTTG
jgi:hypothetical protein